MSGLAVRLISYAAEAEEKCLREKLTNLNYQIISHPPDLRIKNAPFIDLLFVQGKSVSHGTLLNALAPSETACLSILGSVPHPVLQEIVPLSDDFMLWPSSEEELALRLSRFRDRSGLKAGELTFEELAQMNLVGRCREFSRVLYLVKQAAAHKAPVLIEGETGTGKEMVARAIHYLGKRSGSPFVPVNCGSLPDALMENELFGHRKGAYTDAKEDHHGLLDYADRGTIFLDEVEALSPKGQVTLLRFLQDKEFKPLGASSVKKVDVRVIAATNRSLTDMVQQGTFRSDLFFRLNVMAITLPPLRRREGDVELLAEHFMQKFRKMYGQPKQILPARTMRWMKSHDWPGNVRELENAVHRAFLCAEAAYPGAFSDETAARAERYAGSFREAKAKAVQDFEFGYLSELYAKTDGNVTQAAKIAGKDRRAFGKLLNKYNIKDRVGDRK